MAHRSIFPIALLALALSWEPAAAEPAGGGAPVEGVFGICERMAAEKPYSCVMTTVKDGLSGCTAHGCFFCPTDGSRKCYSANKGGRAVVVLGRYRMGPAPTRQ
jgi:hypothetical protein